MLVNELVNYVVFDVGVLVGVVFNSYIGGVGGFFGLVLGVVLMSFFGYVVLDVI